MGRERHFLAKYTECNTHIFIFNYHSIKTFFAISTHDSHFLCFSSSILYSRFLFTSLLSIGKIKFSFVNVYKFQCSLLGLSSLELLRTHSPRNRLTLSTRQLMICRSSACQRPQPPPRLSSLRSKFHLSCVVQQAPCEASPS